MFTRQAAHGYPVLRWPTCIPRTNMHALTMFSPTSGHLCEIRECCSLDRWWWFDSRWHL